MDEWVCNNHTYGIFCPSPTKSRGARRFYNAFEFSPCSSYTDYGVFCRNTTSIEKLCEEAKNPGPTNDITFCNPNKEGRHFILQDKKKLNGKIPLFNFSRCGPIGMHTSLKGLNEIKICDNYEEHTNCSDPARVGLYCNVDGYMSSVATLVICNKQLDDRTEALCDDNIDLECRYISQSCHLHKHQLCDGTSDCGGEIDEVSPLCGSLIDLPCTLRFGSKPVEKIPVQWVLDGMKDCEGGEDEREDTPSCGIQETLRYVSVEDSRSCSEVYLNLCTEDSERKFVEFSGLCDGKGFCGNELSVCRKSRRLHQTFTSSNTIGGVEHLHACLPGLEHLETMVGSSCVRTKFVHPDHEILGRNKVPSLHIPTTTLDCRYMFGLMYVYFSCLGLCENADCPLKDLVHYDSCRDQFPDRIYTLANNSYLTFLIKHSRGSDPSSNIYHNMIFPCDNGKCVGYEKVCNLENDCGDGSDELGCSNHFQCEKTGEFLTHDRVCDNMIDCMDHSDECNELCDKRMINHLVLKIPAGIVGILAFLLNLLTIPGKFSKLRDCKSGDSLTNTTLLLAISCGDFLVGIYILIMISHDLQHGEGYCQMQLRWLTSPTCSAIGILSTTGFHLSVFSMTTLSLQRARKTRSCVNHLKIPTGTSKRDIAYVSFLVFVVLAAAFSLAITPLTSSLEDWFVNGIYYGEQNSLFIGTPGKSKHLEILDEYYGKLGKGSRSLNWSIIKSLVLAMFSKDYSGIEYTKLQFYGNDAVCLFKFFVTVDDPQHTYVWLTIAFNVLCMCVISVSYITVWKVTVASSAPLLSVETGGNNLQRQNIRKRNARLQKKVSLIIASNLVSWAPFIMMSLLHAAKVINANPFYPYFSLLVLPINSVINPIISNEFISRKLQDAKKQLLEASARAFRVYSARVAPEIIQLQRVVGAGNEGDVAPEIIQLQRVVGAGNEGDGVRVSKVSMEWTGKVTPVLVQETKHANAIVTANQDQEVVVNNREILAGVRQIVAGEWDQEVMVNNYKQQMVTCDQELMVDKQQMVAGDQELIVDKQQMVAGDQEVVGDIQQIVARDQEVVADKQQMVAGDQEFMVDKQQMVAVDQELMVNKQQMVTGDQELMVDKQQMVAGDQEVVADIQQMVAGDQEVVANIQQVVADIQQIVAGDQEVMVNKQQMVTGDQELMADKQHMVAGDQEVVADIQQMVAGDQEVVANIQQVVADIQQIVAGDQELMVNKQQMVTGDQELMVDKQQMVAGDQEVVADVQQMVAGDQEVVADKQQMVAGYQELMVDIQQMVAGDQEVVADKQQMVAGDQEGVADIQQIMAGDQEVVADYQEMVEDYQVPRNDGQHEQ